MLTQPVSQIACAAEEFPDWFTLRARAGLFRIDRLRSGDGIMVLANVNGREVGRCSVSSFARTSMSLPDPADSSAG